MHRLISFIGIICVFLIILTGCSSQEEYSIEDKVTEEIKYMENNLIEITNNFALGNYENKNSENNYEFEIYDNEKILEDTRELEEASNRIMVDLTSQNVDNTEILKLSDGINKMIALIPSDDYSEYLIELNNVFSLFPNFEAKVSSNSDEIFERRLKYFTISTYIAFSVGDKELAKNQINTLESEFLEKQKAVGYVEEHKYNLNKIYLLIEELKKGIEQDSLVLVKEKYLLLIKEI